MIYQVLLGKIAKEMKDEGLQLQPPCTPIALKKLRERAVKKLGCPIPDEYADLLAIADGLDYNGLDILASKPAAMVDDANLSIPGFIETNLLFRKNKIMNNYLIFAIDAIALYVFKIDTNEYQSVDATTMQKFESHTSFNELMVEAINTCLE